MTLKYSAAIVEYVKCQAKHAASVKSYDEARKTAIRANEDIPRD